MKYIKTYEQYSVNGSEKVNEELISWIKGLYSKAAAKIATWKDEKKKKAAEGLMKAIEAKKDDPEMQKALEGLKAAAQKLSPEDKNKIQEMGQGNIPDVQAGPKDKELEKTLAGTSESLELLLEEEGLAAKIVSALGLSTGCISFVGLLITVIKIAIAGSGWPIWLGGLTLGTIAGILMGGVVVSGLIIGIGSVMGEEEKPGK